MCNDLCIDLKSDYCDDTCTQLKSNFCDDKCQQPTSDYCGDCETERCQDNSCPSYCNNQCPESGGVKRSELCPQNCSSGVKLNPGEVCCGGVAVPGIGCCGSEPYNEDQCCDDNDEITHKTRKCPANCTGQSFDPLTHKCCGGRTIWELNRDCPSVCDDDNRSLTPREEAEEICCAGELTTPENCCGLLGEEQGIVTPGSCVLR